MDIIIVHANFHLYKNGQSYIYIFDFVFQLIILKHYIITIYFKTLYLQIGFYIHDKCYKQ